MFEFDLGQLPSDIASVLSLRGTELPSLQWEHCANRAAKKLLDSRNELDLFGSVSVVDESMAAGVQALLYLWTGWMADCMMYAQAAPQRESLYIRAFAERCSGRPVPAKELLQQVGEHPIYPSLAASAIAVMKDKADPFLQRFLETTRLGDNWEPFAYVDLFQQGVAEKLSLNADGVARFLQCREYELLFAFCYKRATGVALAPRQKEGGCQIRRRPVMTRGCRRTPAGATAIAGGRASEKRKPAAANEPSEPLKIICPKCKARLLFPAMARGRQVKCARCNAEFKIPEPSPSRMPVSSRGGPIPSGVKVLCPRCGKGLVFPVALRGRKETCTSCGTAFLIPDQPAARAI